MRPTGKLHLGHWLGTLKNWVRLQDEYQCVYGIVDWHALTTEYANVSGLADNVIEVALDWLATGIDPKKATVMIQSLVPEHAELHLLFSMIIPVPWLERVPTYKEQQQQLSDRDLSTYGFLGYPLLQAADILVYKAEVVPVGEDQVPHIELTREVARRFNKFYGDLLPEPQALLSPVAKLLGTDGRKMSKSYGNAIYLSDSPEEVRKKVMVMMTDPQRTHRHIPGNPDVCPVYSYHKVFTATETTAAVDRDCRTAAIGCVDCKKTLAASLTTGLEPIYTKRKELETRRQDVRDILLEGSQAAHEMAQNTMTEVRKAANIYYGRE